MVITRNILENADLVEHDYIQQMLESIEIDRVKYEPNRKKRRLIQDMFDDENVQIDEASYIKYVEKEYMYFRTLDSHYKNLGKC